MLITDQLFSELFKKAFESPRLRMHYDLRDSEEEQGQRMLNALLPGTKSAIHRHNDTSEDVFCIYGNCIERFYDEDGNETEEFHLVAGTDHCGIIIPPGQYHSLEATDTSSVVMECKAGRYDPQKTEEIL